VARNWSARLEFSRELRGLPVALLPLGIIQRLLVTVNQQHVFHLIDSIRAERERFSS